MTTLAPPQGAELTDEAAVSPSPTRTADPSVLRRLTLAAPERSAVRVILIVAGTQGQTSTTSMPASLDPVAAVVIAADGDPHRDEWPGPAVPVLVVLPPHAPPSAVLAAFRAGADACVSTASSAEVTAHLGALLRRNALRVTRS